MSVKKELEKINERLKYKELHRSNVAERIKRAVIRNHGKTKAKEVRIKDIE